MGYNTWLSLPKKPLPLRLNCIISSKNANEIQSCNNSNIYSFSSIDEMIDNFDFFPKEYQDADIFVIGGEILIKYFIENRIKFDKIFLSKIHGNYNCDKNISFLEKELANYNLIKIIYEDTFEIYEYKLC